MAWWRRLFARKAVSIEQRLLDALESWFTARSGATVSVGTALQVSVVLACARVIAEGVAQLPLKLMRPTEDGRGSEPASGHRLYDLLHRQPNEWQTSFEFREMLTTHAVLCGGGFAYINRGTGDAVRELLPLQPRWVTVKRQLDWSLRYEVRASLAGDRGEVRHEFGPAEILHLRGPSWDGVVGLDMVRQAREAIGLALATEEHHARMHANGVAPSGMISVDGNLDEPSYKRFKTYVEAELAGTRNTGKPFLGDRGAKWVPFDAKGVDQQHVETRRLQIEEICRFMRVFPLMVMQADKTATFASAEQFFLAHVTHTLGPWIARWEQAIQRDVLGADAREFPKFAVQGLLRGDAVSRAGFYSRGILDGWMTRNEARGLEDLNPLAGLDEPLRPLNMGRGSEMPPDETRPTETPPAPPADDPAEE